MPAPKIVTCCYCGTRAALVLRGKERHELSCASCGAPLHDLKMLRADQAEDRGSGRPSGMKAKAPRGRGDARGSDPRRRKGKRRKGFGQWFLEEAWDAIEDIFD